VAGVESGSRLLGCSGSHPGRKVRGQDGAPTCAVSWRCVGVTVGHPPSRGRLVHEVTVEGTGPDGGRERSVLSRVSKARPGAPSFFCLCQRPRDMGHPPSVFGGCTE